jgi:hypothetical protein
MIIKGDAMDRDKLVAMVHKSIEAREHKLRLAARADAEALIQGRDEIVPRLERDRAMLEARQLRLVDAIDRIKRIEGYAWRGVKRLDRNERDRSSDYDNPYRPWTPPDPQA